MQSLRKLAIAASTFACAAMLSFGWSEQGGVSLSIDKAQAYYHHRLFVGRHYSPYYAYTGEGLPWYAVRAYYAGGPWSGAWWSYTGWPDYAARNGIVCTPGTVIKGGDGILYICQ